jgi:hypothetical protein
MGQSSCNRTIPRRWSNWQSPKPISRLSASDFHGNWNPCRGSKVTRETHIGTFVVSEKVTIRITWSRQVYHMGDINQNSLISLQLPPSKHRRAKSWFLANSTFGSVCRLCTKERIDVMLFESPESPLSVVTQLSSQIFHFFLKNSKIFWKERKDGLPIIRWLEIQPISGREKCVFLSPTFLFCFTSIECKRPFLACQVLSRLSPFIQPPFENLWQYTRYVPHSYFSLGNPTSLGTVVTATAIKRTASKR